MAGHKTKHRISWLFLAVLLIAGGFSGAAQGMGYNPPRTESPLPDVKINVFPRLKADVEERGFRWGDPVFLRIFKEEKMLELWIKNPDRSGRYSLYKSYGICRHSGNLGPKLREGDKQAPEGFYTVPQEMLHPRSRFHLALNLGYPNEYDAAHGRTGSFLMIHGKCTSKGCFAMNDRNIEEIYLLSEAALEKGQPVVPVHIFPFRLEGERLYARRNHKWFPFWENLREGYEYFEQHRRPPEMAMYDGRYVIAGQSRHAGSGIR